MKRFLGLVNQRPIGTLAFCLLLMAGIIAGQNVSANATIVQTTNRIINNGSADFGSGYHSGGGPTGAATVTYDWTTTSTGQLGITGRVRGTLYWDSFFGGCSRLIIRFRNSANVDLDVQPFDACGPGGNANATSNKVAIDFSFSSTALDSIVLTTGVVQGGGLGGARNTTITQVRTVTYPIIIENGTADFGDGYHAFGVPQEAGTVSFTRNGNATVTGTVNGILYWDSFSDDSCARLIIEFRNIEGQVLRRNDSQQCGPGGDANAMANQFTIFNVSSTRGDLFEIRLRVDDLNLAGDITSEIIGFGGIVG
jgi:hypothetical protein